MKDFSNYLPEKPYSCDVDGCSMKFSNENHLTVHKKRHDMTLCISLGVKGTTFTDQTPTPTQFIRNCEEVGLFQDLQNVDPFEETFRKAVEAVKAGQPIPMGKSSTNQTDDTLHTPNIFPHITDVPSESFMKSEPIPPCEDNLLKQEITNPEKLCPTNITTNPPAPPPPPPQQTSSHLPQQTPEGTSENQHLPDNKVILNVPEGHFVHLITPDATPNPCNMVVIKNSVSDLYPLSVKDKLKKSLSDKKDGKCLQQKVPILKCPTKRTTNTLSNKFSKFSKNAMKMISKLESSGNGEFDISELAPRRQKKEKTQSKESRSEFLARSRAASSRCREKKKMYVLYLEKVNNELTTANQNLQIINSILRKEMCDLHAELLKHRNCNAADKNTEEILKLISTFVEHKSNAAEKEKVAAGSLPPPKTNPIEQLPVSPLTDLVPSPSDFSPSELDTFSLDVAEVILGNNSVQDHEIPLTEACKPPDIIVKFNSTPNFHSKVPSDPCFDSYIETAGDNVKQIYSEHSYYFKKAVEERRVINYKTFRESMGSVSEDCKKMESLKLKNSDAFRDITSLNTRVLLEPRNVPPLILLKPFKKRSIQNKSEKT